MSERIQAERCPTCPVRRSISLQCSVGTRIENSVPIGLRPVFFGLSMVSQSSASLYPALSPASGPGQIVPVGRSVQSAREIVTRSALSMLYQTADAHVLG